MHIALALAGVKLLLHLVSELLARGHGYGFFRDELYYLACGRHLAWGYPDHAPLVSWLASLFAGSHGESPLLLRLVVALVGALRIVAGGLVVVELGGGRLAALLAGVSLLVAPGFLVMDSMLTMNALEGLLWPAAAWALLVARRTGRLRWWVALGVLAGLSILAKHSSAFFIGAIFVGLLVSPRRPVLFTRGPWLAAGVALLLVLPHLVWQVREHWPILETLATVRRSGKNIDATPLQYLLQQLMLVGPLGVLITLAGLARLAVRRGAEVTILGVAFLALLAFFMVTHGKNYYLAPAYPMVIAAGAVALAARRWLAGGLAALQVLTLAFAPLVLPLLSPARTMAYQRALGIEPPRTERGHVGTALPQHLADRFGWPEMVAGAATAWSSLPEAERRGAVIYAGNYGEAGAIDQLGPRHGLPAATSAHNAYFLWGPRGERGDTLICLQCRRADLEKICSTVEDGPLVTHPWSMSYERFIIYLCRGLRQPLRDLWPRLKRFN